MHIQGAAYQLFKVQAKLNTQMYKQTNRWLSTKDTSGPLIRIAMRPRVLESTRTEMLRNVSARRGAVGFGQQWALLCVWREARRAKAGGVGNAKAQRSLYTLPRRRCKRSWWSSSRSRRDRLPQKSAALSGQRSSRQSVVPLFLHLSPSRGAGVTLHELLPFFSNRGRIPPFAPGISPRIFTPEMDGFAGSLGERVSLSVQWNVDY